MKVIRKDGQLFFELWLSIPSNAKLKEGIFNHNSEVDMISFKDEDAYLSEQVGLNLHRMLVKVPTQYIPNDLEGEEG